jgi:hypothetical protein
MFQRSMLPPCSGWRWGQHGPLKCWFPSTILQRNPEGLELNLHCHENTNFTPNICIGITQTYTECIHFTKFCFWLAVKLQFFQKHSSVSYTISEIWAFQSFLKSILSGWY